MFVVVSGSLGNQTDLISLPRGRNPRLDLRYQKIHLGASYSFYGSSNPCGFVMRPATVSRSSDYSLAPDDRDLIQIERTSRTDINDTESLYQLVRLIGCTLCEMIRLRSRKP